MYITYGKQIINVIKNYNMENKKLEETIKRFKELISEERLYGNLVDKTLLTESNISSRLKSALKSLDEFGEGIALKNMNFNMGELSKIANDLEEIYSNFGKIKDTTKSLDNVNKSLDDIKKRVNDLLTEDSIKDLADNVKDLKRSLKNDIITNIDSMKSLNDEIKETISIGGDLSDNVKKYIKEDFGEDFLKKMESDIIHIKKFKNSVLGKISNNTQVNNFKNYSSGLVRTIKSKKATTFITNIFNYVLNPVNYKPLKINDKTSFGILIKLLAMSWAYYIIINKTYCKFFYSWKNKYNLDDLNKKNVNDLTDGEVDSKAWLDLMDAIGILSYIGFIFPSYSEVFECVTPGEYESPETTKKIKEGLGKTGIDISEEEFKNNINTYKNSLGEKMNLENTMKEFQNELNKMTPEEKRNLLSN